MGGGFEAQNLKNSDVFTKIESDFSAEIGNSNVFFAQIQVVSKKKKKKLFTKIETDFSPDWLRLGRWGGMYPEMEPNYSKQRLIFRPKSLLLGWWGGCIPPIPPPKSATGHGFHSQLGRIKNFKNWYSLLPCLTFSIKGTV